MNKIQKYIEIPIKDSDSWSPGQCYSCPIKCYIKEIDLLLCPLCTRNIRVDDELSKNTVMHDCPLKNKVKYYDKSNQIKQTNDTKQNFTKDDTWEIMCNISSYIEEITKNNIQKFTKEREQIDKLYAQLVRLQCKQSCGYIMTIKDFISTVDEGFINDFDGFGKFMDFDGNKYETVHCNVNWLNKNKKDYLFVIWFNK
jgi:hypothetical protein